jgi:hypothetical protein
MIMMKVVFALIGPMIYIPNLECGERHLFLATSVMYPAGTSEGTTEVPLPTGLAVARGTDGKSGSGVYSIDQFNESAGPR